MTRATKTAGSFPDRLRGRRRLDGPSFPVQPEKPGRDAKGARRQGTRPALDINRAPGLAPGALMVPKKCLRTLLWLNRNGNFCLFGGALLASQPAEIRGNVLSKAPPSIPAWSHSALPLLCSLPHWAPCRLPRPLGAAAFRPRGTAHVAAADYHQRALPSDTSQELVFDGLLAPGPVPGALSCIPGKRAKKRPGSLFVSAVSGILRGSSRSPGTRCQNLVHPIRRSSFS